MKTECGRGKQTVLKFVVVRITGIYFDRPDYDIIRQLQEIMLPMDK